jgi:hypothetical protein
LGKFILVLFIASFIFFVGVIHNLLGLKKPGIYPPKQLLRKRAGSLAVGAVFFLLIGIVFYAAQ